MMNIPGVSAGDDGDYTYVHGIKDEFEVVRLRCVFNILYTFFLFLCLFIQHDAYSIIIINVYISLK